MREERKIGTQARPEAQLDGPDHRPDGQCEVIDQDALDGVLAVHQVSSAAADQVKDKSKEMFTGESVSASDAITQIERVVAPADGGIIKTVLDEPVSSQFSPLSSVTPSENQDVLASHPATNQAAPEFKGSKQIVRFLLIVAIGLVLASIIWSSNRRERRIDEPTPASYGRVDGQLGMVDVEMMDAAPSPSVAVPDSDSAIAEPEAPLPEVRPNGLPETLPETVPKSPDLNEPLILPVTFNTGSFRSQINIEQIYSIIAPLLAKNKGIILIGHTDRRGKPKLNYQLGLKRAAYIKKLLVLKGISSKRIRVKSRGANVPLSLEDTNEGLALNRRVEVRIYTK